MEGVLDGISEAIKTQDNRITQHPLFGVYNRRCIYGMDSDYWDTDYVIVDRNCTDCVYETEIEALENGVLQEDFVKSYYITVGDFVNAHFTERAAQKYINENRHNLTDPYIYVTSLYRCPEMIAIRELLMRFEEER